jgi:hypothetical protein
MMAAEIHKNDIGTMFKVTIRKEDDSIKDLSSYTTKQLIFKKPSGTILTKTATFLTDGTDGIIYYTSISGDLDEIGAWKLQAYLHDGSSNYRKSNIGAFRVFENLS